MNNMNGWSVPREPNRLQGKLDFLRDYKFTLAVENNIWPGYTTEKLVDPMFAGSIPIYVGDPQANSTSIPKATSISVASTRCSKCWISFGRSTRTETLSQDVGNPVLSR